MNGKYTVFKRDKDGIREASVMDFSSLEIDLIWADVSKFELEGTSIGAMPFTAGDRIVIYRNGTYFFSGIISKTKSECEDPVTNVRQWTASGTDESVCFSRRMVLADPVDFTFDEDSYDQYEDTAYNRMIHYVRNCYGEGTTEDRQLFPLVLPSKQDIGVPGLSAYRRISLSKVLEEIGEEDKLYPLLEQDDKTGDWRVTIPTARDMTDEVIISPEYGNVLKWSKTESLPGCNAVWVVSGDYSAGRLYIYAEDRDSVEKYGRIEKILLKDYKVYDPPEPSEDEEEEWVPIKDGDEEKWEADHLTEEDVLRLLEQDAEKYLRENCPQTTWRITAAETRDLAFMDKWKSGDLVTCVIDGERFQSQITRVEITYENGVETVEPAIGDIDRGLFGGIYNILKGLDDRITEKENES